MASTGTEFDPLGAIELPSDRLWVPQTRRARCLSQIGTEHFHRS